MGVDVERLRIEILLSQSVPSPQCDLLPRRLPTVGTGSDEPGTPRWSPAIGTGSDEPGVLRAKSRSTERKESFLLQASLNGILHVNSASPEQECILLQPDDEADDEDKTTTCTSENATACDEFARLTIGRQQRETASSEQSKQFDPGG